MTIAAAASMSARTAGWLRGWLSVRHSLRAEAVVVFALYGLYELARGLVVGNAGEAVRHARELVALERSTGLLVEERVQGAAHALPGLIDLLSIAYLTLHLAVTVAVLLWLHRRRPAAFPLVRTTLVLASGLALVGYLVFPTAPPRLSGIGITDTVSGGHVDLNTGLVSSLYNPYAAVPSMHIGFALVVGASLLRYGRRRAVRLLIGLPYPAFALLVVVAQPLPRRRPCRRRRGRGRRRRCPPTCAADGGRPNRSIPQSPGARAGIGQAGRLTKAKAGRRRPHDDPRRTGK